jgi:hypothetical protein
MFGMLQVFGLLDGMYDAHRSFLAATTPILPASPHTHSANLPSCPQRLLQLRSVSLRWPSSSATIVLLSVRSSA